MGGRQQGWVSWLVLGEGGVEGGVRGGGGRVCGEGDGGKGEWWGRRWRLGVVGEEMGGGCGRGGEGAGGVGVQSTGKRGGRLADIPHRRTGKFILTNWTIEEFAWNCCWPQVGDLRSSGSA